MKTDFENIYDRYSPMLYGIALQLCPATKKAEEILVLTFKKIEKQNLSFDNNKPLSIILIKLIIETAQDELSRGKTRCNFKIKLFENTPLIHQLLVQQNSVANYCIDNNISRHQALLNIRDEFKLIRKSSRKNNKIEIKPLMQLI